MDLLSYFRLLRRRWLLLLVFVLAGAAIGAASVELKGKTPATRNYYRAASTLVLDTSTDNQFAYNNVEQIAILVTTGDVPGEVAKAIGSDEPGRDLAQQIVTTTAQVPSTIEITAADPDAERASELANAFGDELIKSVTARVTDRYDASRDRLNQQLTQLKAQADAFLAQLNAQPRPADFDTIKAQYDATQNEYYSTYGQLQELVSNGAPQSGLSMLQRAQAVPISKGEYQSRLSLGASGQNHLRAEATQDGSSAIGISSSGGTTLDDPLSRGIVGALLGLFAGMGLALVLDRFDRRIRTRTEAEDAFGLPVVAEVPEFTRAQQRSNEVVAFHAPLSRAAEAYRAARTSLLFQQQSANEDRTSSPNGNGNAAAVDANGATSAGVADVFEPKQQGRLVLMVTSASPREGKTNTCVNLAATFAEAGARVLIVNCDFRRPNVHRLLGVPDEPRKVCDTPIPNVKVVTNVLADTTANPSRVAAAQRQVIAAARPHFDVVLLDTAPVLTANDAIEIVDCVDFVLLVARAGLTTTDLAERTMEVLTRLDAPLGGVLLAASTQSSNDYYYYYQRGRAPSGGRRAARRANANAAASDSVPVAPATPDE